MTEVVSEQTPPILHGPSDKERKYDRQLRLWAANGQQALEDAHILLVNSGSGAVGVETLKNLVLPGIGNFTISDDAIVEEADLGVNFFLDEQSLGKPRAQCCAALLEELNPDVNGHWHASNGSSTFLDVLENKSTYTLVVYTSPIEASTQSKLERYCQKHKTPLIAIHSAGFYSYFQVIFPGNFPIVDTHPDSTAIIDLRLLSPWPELSEFARDMTSNLEKLNDHDHGHIPYIVLLLYFLEQWRASHNGIVPQSYSEKVAFRNMVNAGARIGPEGGEENFDEATAAVLKTITAPSLSSSVRETFDYVPDETEAASRFWIITDAVKAFYAKHGVLPLPGTVPDMKAQSQTYVKLQTIYKNKAREDVAEVVEIMSKHPHAGSVDIQEVEMYCKNAAHIKLIRATQSTSSDLKKLAELELNAEFALSPTLLPIYLVMKAKEQAQAASEDEIVGQISKTLGEMAKDDRIVQAAAELIRAGDAELHNISALTGGMVAQEIIKIITKQYVPVDNTCIFDGITSRTQTIKI